MDVKNLASVFHQFLDANTSIVKLAGDASSREYFRLQNKEKKTFILQSSGAFSDPESHPFLIAQKLFSLEAKLPVPQILAFDAKTGWILMEDLGDLPLQDCQKIEDYKTAIDYLVVLAKTFVGQRQFCDVELQQAPHFTWAFDFEKLQWEMGFTAEHLISKYAKDSAHSQQFLDAVEQNSRFLADRPRVLCHRDYHSRNLMIHQGRPYIIDFQDARMGPVSYDLVSLLWDPYARLSNAWISTLLEDWKIKINKTLPQFLDSSFEEELQRMKIQRLLKAAGSYASFFNLKGRSDYLQHIAPAIETVIEAISDLRKIGKANQNEEFLFTYLQRYTKHS